MTDDTRTNMRDALEQLLADKAATEPGFLEAVVLDPKGTVEPLMAQLLHDDGELDLTGINVNVHVQTADTMHLVVNAGDQEEAEVAGFRMGGLGVKGILSIGVMAPPRMGGAMGLSSGCDSTCHTDTNSTDHCAGGDCASSSAL